MELRCKQAFGYNVPGDIVVVPDGTTNFDTFYFEEIQKVADKKVTEKVPDKLDKGN